ncbi:DUF6328 family protein [Acidovorax sp. PRC11]|jgi:hypothetical protein|nr:DUF6328 family protein [Acidovorax sp. PRC11]MDT0138245.1 DUF6328 family protein [Acidovorax sp. PRC11]
MSKPEGFGNEPDELSDDGDLTDMLGELRVLLPTAQLLSAFLITVPFTPGFSAIAYTEKWVFLATFVLAVVGLVLLSAPAVQHRLIRPLLDRPRFKSLASRQILAGAVALASALVSGAQLVLSTIFGHVVGSLAAALVAGLIFLLWWWLPRRWKQAGKL